jgi:hypothetical protein
MYRDARGRVCSLFTSWTSVAPADPYVVLSAGRSLFRVEDLVALVELVRRLSSGEPPEAEGAGGRAGVK